MLLLSTFSILVWTQCLMNSDTHLLVSQMIHHVVRSSLNLHLAETFVLCILVSMTRSVPRLFWLIELALFMVWCLWVHPMIGMLVTFWWIRLSHQIIPVYFKILNSTIYITSLDHSSVSAYSSCLYQMMRVIVCLSAPMYHYTFFYNVLSHQVPEWSCYQLTCGHRGKYTSWMFFKDISLESIDN